jgi:hypothetical protein
MGGFYERLIGITKRAITKALGRSKLRSEQWDTLIAEVESTVNSRPLTYVREDDEATSILTPNHFLSHNPVVAFPNMSTDDPDFVPVVSGRELLVASWSRENQLLQSFWRTWTNQYLLSLPA